MGTAQQGHQYMVAVMVTVSVMVKVIGGAGGYPPANGGSEGAQPPGHRRARCQECPS